MRGISAKQIVTPVLGDHPGSLSPIRGTIIIGTVGGRSLTQMNHKLKGFMAASAVRCFRISMVASGGVSPIHNGAMCCPHLVIGPLGPVHRQVGVRTVISSFA